MSQTKTRIVILIDVNLDGHARLIDAELRSEWNEFREDLGLELRYFNDVGLVRDAMDHVVWRFCQEQGYYLLTGNRRQESEDSLEATIRRERTDDSLPIFTVSDPRQILQSKAYRNKIVEKMIDYLLFRQLYLGTGRLYLP